MHWTERAAQTLRHAPGLRRLDPLWDRLRPLYDGVVGRAGQAGLARRINGTDIVRVSPRHRGVTESYEPEVWARFAAELRPGDTFVDVGAYIGLYAIAAAGRVGTGGRVVAFEPDPENATDLRRHVTLNGVTVEVVEAAVGAREGRVTLDERAIETQAQYAPDGGVLCVTLDTIFPDTRVDVLKVDVEGFEEEVLLGASRLLSDPARRPRALLIEVHPFAWERTRTTGASLLGTIRGFGYRVETVDGTPVTSLTTWSEVVAVPDAALAADA